jgi:hypothetical protein
VDTYVAKPGFHDLLTDRYEGIETGMSRKVQTFRSSRHLIRGPQSDGQCFGGKVAESENLYEGSKEVRTDSNKKVVWDHSTEVTCFVCQVSGSTLVIVQSLSRESGD